MNYPIGKILYLDGEEYIVTGYQDFGKTIELLCRGKTVLKNTSTVVQKSNEHWMDKIRQI